jgi:orotidine-5'-phosphate decarboxylase
MKPKLVIALDTDIKKAKKIVNIAKNFGFEFFKIGHLLFDTTPEIIDYITSQNLKVILDLKFHDIPSVISKTISKLLEKYKIFAFTVHTLGGEKFLKEVKKATTGFSEKPIIFAVTILTSLEDKDLKRLGFKNNVKSNVINLAKLVKSCGVDGVVCSPKEVKFIKQICGKNFLTLVPGISLSNLNKTSDQQRTSSIKEIVSSGADFIVVGRSIYESENIEYTLQYLYNLTKE